MYIQVKRGFSLHVNIQIQVESIFFSHPYRTGDMAQFDIEKCGCGRHLGTMKRYKDELPILSIPRMADGNTDCRWSMWCETFLE
jgi:hypothetical protein